MAVAARIAMIFPGVLGYLPPAVTAAVALQASGEDVTLVAAGCEHPTGEALAEAGVKCLHLGMSRYPRSALGKATLRLRFGLHLCNSLRALRPDVVWYHTAHAMEYRRLVSWFAPKALTVAHAHELYDEHRRLRSSQERAIAASVCWITPEKNRAKVLRAATRSSAPDWVVPNRPLETLADLPPGFPDTVEVYRRHDGSPACQRFVIYQGLIADGRCLLQAVEAFRGMRRPDVGLIVLGECLSRRFNASLRAASHDDRRIVLVERVPPPLHLRITAGTDVGLVLYEPSTLNNRFCAPGKLFEYAWCGLGVVMPAFPPLLATTEPFGFGRSCDPLDPSSIAAALEKEIDRDPDQRREAASAFLHSSPSPAALYGEVGAYLRVLVDAETCTC